MKIVVSESRAHRYDWHNIAFCSVDNRSVPCFHCRPPLRFELVHFGGESSAPASITSQNKATASTADQASAANVTRRDAQREIEKAVREEEEAAKVSAKELRLCL